jgi:DHA3 family multidrug efflux protein-like MFS transporter
MFYVLLLWHLRCWDSASCILALFADRCADAGAQATAATEAQEQGRPARNRCAWCAASRTAGLIGFSCFNNFLGGAFMALMDAYGLSLMSVQAGVCSGVRSARASSSGARRCQDGLRQDPVRLLLLVNVVLWSVTCVSRCVRR